MTHAMPTQTYTATDTKAELICKKNCLGLISNELNKHNKANCFRDTQKGTFYIPSGQGKPTKLDQVT